MAVEPEAEEAQVLVEEDRVHYPLLFRRSNVDHRAQHTLDNLKPVSVHNHHMVHHMLVHHMLAFLRASVHAFALSAS